MKKKIFVQISSLMLALLLMVGCTGSDQGAQASSSEGKIRIVATTTMLADLVKQIGGDRVSVSGLMAAGVDPHLYQASAGDVQLMQDADAVVYNGLHLEGKLGEIFESLEEQDKFVVCIEYALQSSELILTEEGVHDPHIWFDVDLWKKAAAYVAAQLSEYDKEGEPYYLERLNAYLDELNGADVYIRSRIAEIPEESRVLVTAHDAFNYFGRAYGVEVRGLQGISTEAEAGTADMSALAEFIAERRIKAIFVESSVPTKTIEALQAAVQAQGFDVGIGGELYSDSLGDEASGTETYIKTVKANADTIANALK